MPPQPNALEDLIVENARSHPSELMNARGVPRDEQATADLKDDDKRMARLAELAEVDPARIVDVAVRGTNVTFQVADGLKKGAPSGALSVGYFPLADLGSKSGKPSAGMVQNHSTEATPAGGTATVPSVTDPGRGQADTEQAEAGLRTGGTGDDGGGSEQPPPDGDKVPDNLDGLNARDTAKLFSDPEVNKAAVLAHEQARTEGDGGPRKSVLDAARKAGLDVPDDS